MSKDVRGQGHLLSPGQWAEAMHILESQGITFTLFLGNELLSYPDPVGFIEAMYPFWGRYAIYSTFPSGWLDKLEAILATGKLYNISSGVDVYPGLYTGDTAVDRKSSAALYWLDYCKQRGVPDVHATITIHRHNYDKLDPLLDLISNKGIHIACSLVEASADGKHDFYGDVPSMKDWLIPEEERGKFRDEMYRLAAEIRKGRWKMQVPPMYFEEIGDREVARDPWHCSIPILIHVEEDGSLRACSYRGGLDVRHSVFDLREGGSLTMQKYVELMETKTKQCPGCGVGGGAWSYHWQAEFWLRGEVEAGDKVFQLHAPGYEFEESLRTAS